MAKFIYKSTNNTTMELVDIKGGKQIINIRLTDDESEVNHAITENQAYDLQRQLNGFLKKYKANKPLIAKVSFYGINGSTVQKQYNFYTNIKTLRAGDKIIVDSRGVETEAEFVKYIENPQSYPTKWVIRKHKPTYLTDDNVFIVPPKKEELTTKGFTNQIKIAEDQTKDSLLNYGFSNYHKPTLYYCKMVGSDVSLNISLDINTLEIKQIDVLDEDFGQPYDYQAIILKGKANESVIKIYHNVNNELAKLQHDGIITGFEKGMYI